LTDADGAGSPHKMEPSNETLINWLNRLATRSL
jgi:hypothetical protein